MRDNSSETKSGRANVKKMSIDCSMTKYEVAILNPYNQWMKEIGSQLPLLISDFLFNCEMKSLKENLRNYLHRGMVSLVSDMGKEEMKDQSFDNDHFAFQMLFKFLDELQDLEARRNYLFEMGAIQSKGED